MNRFARVRPKPGVMNKTEQAYADRLEALRAARQIQSWKFEAVKLRLADKTFYSPDFLVVDADGYVELHEVKGFWEDDARVKVKVAAEQFPFRFLAVKKVSKAKGEWEFEEF